MSIVNRVLRLLDSWGRTAQTSIPNPPVKGQAYRNTALSSADILAAWSYESIVDSADHNQFMYILSALMLQLEQQGILAWCAGTTYPAGAICLGSNSLIYISLQDANINNDPVTSTAYWSLFLQPATATAAGISQLATAAEVAAGVNTSKTITPSTLRNGGGFIRPSGATVFNTTMAETDVWQELDLSSIIGQRTALLFLEVKNSGTGAYAVKPNGTGGVIPSKHSSSGDNGYYGAAGFNPDNPNNYAYLVCMTDATGKVQHGASSHSDTFTIKLTGYII